MLAAAVVKELRRIQFEQIILYIYMSYRSYTGRQSSNIVKIFFVEVIISTPSPSHRNYNFVSRCNFDIKIYIHDKHENRDRHTRLNNTGGPKVTLPRKKLSIFITIGPNGLIFLARIETCSQSKSIGTRLVRTLVKYHY
jgi:hypothetical protein